MKLQEIWGVPKDQLFEGGPKRNELANAMPQWASPVHWLAEVTNCTIVWYNAIIFPPNLTENQIQTIKKLMEHNCINHKPSIEVTMEYQICKENTNVALLELIAKKRQALVDEISKELQI
jgi:hypothetical protein